MPKYPLFKEFARSKFAKDSLLYVASSLVVGFLGYLFNFFVSRKISVAQYGELQSLFAILSIFGVYSAALGYFIVKHVSVFSAHEDKEASRDFTGYLFRKTKKPVFLGLVVFILLIPFLSRLLHLSDSVGLIAIGITIFISFPLVIYGEILRGWNKFFVLAFISIISAIAKLVSGAGLAIIFQKASAISFSIFVAAIFGLFLSRFFSRKTIGISREQKSFQNWKEKYFPERNIRKTAIQIFIFSAGIILISNLDIIIVKNLMSPDTAGYYGALALVGKIILIINLAVVAVMLPGACADGYLGKRPSSKHIFGAYSLVIVSSLVLILLYSFLSSFVVNLFFGSKYLLQANNLWLFGLMSFFLSLVTLEANLAFAKHEFRVVYYLMAIVIAMVLGGAGFHANLREIVVVFSAIFLLGYFAILSLNLSRNGENKNLSVAAGA
ncbi:MAG: lipopolysaccharide biosynthesis protein [Parcubacteria group bacterium]|jgi:O-antigen/teichoic acid export membrane protein